MAVATGCAPAYFFAACARGRSRSGARWSSCRNATGPGDEPDQPPAACIDIAGIVVVGRSRLRERAPPKVTSRTLIGVGYTIVRTIEELHSAEERRPPCPCEESS